MHRRTFLAASGALLATGANAAVAPSPTPFDGATVLDLARKLAAAPYKRPETALPANYSDLTYQQYQGIRFKPEKSLWHAQGRNFTAQFFHRGYIYQDRVTVYEVTGGHAAEIPYSPDLFTFDKVTPSTGDLGFAGFRLLYPLNHPGSEGDELCAFLGASYFRAVGKGMGYGLSARGLAIDTASPSGEEFPVFRAFWLERPPDGANVIVVHALLDSPSTTGAFRFTIRPGDDTIFDTETVLCPRTDIAQSGLAPLTSMYLFAPNDRVRFDDWREAVHDSDGLQMLTGRGERIWRPLNNPRNLQISVFEDTGPRGFGLIQRGRRFVDYQDLEAHYEKRPSLWVEPVGDWGSGTVELVEIPSNREVNDNIVAFWRPHQPLRAKGEYVLDYRLHWCWAAPGAVTLAQVMATRCGTSFNPAHRQFVIDFVGDALKPLTPQQPPAADVGASAGRIVSAVVEPNPYIDGWRISIELDPEGKTLVELHARLMHGGQPLSELWLYRWTPG